MSTFSFTDPVTGRVFDIKGPPSLTEAQAEEIFQQQLEAGSLVGLKPGSVLNAAKQAAGGLTAAASQVTQALAGVGGSAQGALTGALNAAKNAASSLPAQLDVNSITSAANKTLNTISGVLQSGPVTTVVNGQPVAGGINIADFARQATALVPIQGLAVSDVTATLAAVSKNVGQSAGAISNTLGVGKFGLDGSQLERAGILKPGTVSTYLAGGANQLTDVLKSPAVFTGKGGITDVNKLLGSVPGQNKIQQELMSQGLSQVKALGIPTNSLDPKALSGLAANAAKSVTGTLDWAQGAQLPSAVKAQYDKLAQDTAFATTFTDIKVDPAMKEQEPGIPAIDTVDRATVNAAAGRVTGNKKIPPTDYNTAIPRLSAAELEQRFDEAANTFGDIADRFKIIARKTNDERAATNSYNDDIRAVEGLINDLNELDSVMQGLIVDAKNLEPPDSSTVARIEKAQTFVPKLIASYEGAILGLRRLAAGNTA